MAVIGESLDLKCGITCHSLTYEWYRIVNHSEKNKVEGQTGRVLRVSDNVTSVEEVGGLIYECNCSGSSDCQFFEIGGNASSLHFVCYIFNPRCACARVTVVVACEGCCSCPVCLSVCLSVRLLPL